MNTDGSKFINSLKPRRWFSISKLPFQINLILIVVLCRKRAIGEKLWIMFQTWQA